MDPNLLAELGVCAVQIPVVANVVQPTVSQFKTAFDLEGKQTLALSYGLSLLLMAMISLATDPSATVPALVATTTAKVAVAAWLAATFAGNAADAQRRNDVKRQAKREASAALPDEKGSEPALYRG